MRQMSHERWTPKLTEEVHEKITETLAKLRRELFMPEVRLTLLARLPGDREADVLVTDDSLGAIRVAIDRAEGRRPK